MRNRFAKTKNGSHFSECDGFVGEGDVGFECSLCNQSCIDARNVFSDGDSKIENHKPNKQTNSRKMSTHDDSEIENVKQNSKRNQKNVF